MQTRGTFPGLYDNIDKVVFTVAKTTLKALPSIANQYFRQETSDRKFEQRLPYAGFTTVPAASEGDDVTVQQILSGTAKNFTHLLFKVGFEATQEAEEDDQYDVLSDKAGSMARAARVTQETYAARLMTLGFTTETTPDGDAIYSASHALITGGSMSNLSTADLSRSALEAAITLLHTDGKSEEGHFMAPPNGYWLEVPPALEFLAERIAKSKGLPGSADNDINALNSRYGIDVIVNPYFSDADSWRIVAKNKMHGLLTYKRVGISMEAPVTIPRSGNRLYKTRFRQSWGADRWQGLVASEGA